MKDGILVEHWDVIQDEATDGTSFFGNYEGSFRTVADTNSAKR